jgi:hypothetical protein
VLEQSAAGGNPIPTPQSNALADQVKASVTSSGRAVFATSIDWMMSAGAMTTPAKADQKANGQGAHGSARTMRPAPMNASISANCRIKGKCQLRLP